VGGYAAAYDLVAAEYGWTDEQIGELPLARLRQVTAAIQMRKFSAFREENSRFSWLARNIAGFIAAGYQIEKGKENKALDQAGKLAFDDIELALLGGKVQSPDQPAENGAGSFERFMGMMGHLEQRGKML
jgi:hypothetical protein